VCLGVVPHAAGAQRARGPETDAPPERIDYLTFAQGAVPLTIGGAGAKLGANFTAAVRITDGDPNGFTIVNNAPADVETEFVYELPAMTTFDRFAVPNVLETPSPAATFTRHVEVHGSATGPSGAFTLLASGTLTTHKARGQIAELTVASRTPVRWIKIRLVGGINVLRPVSSFEFSEIIGNGTQEIPQLVTSFQGGWRTQATRMRLTQRGPVVSGCFDKTGDLDGTVSGNVLRATGVDRSDKTLSAFILTVAPDGSLRGVRSTNGSPFRLYTAEAAPAGTDLDCATPAPPVLGCGSIIHGINFDFDSATIRPESNAVLVELFAGLKGDKSAKIVIEGHTSSEGSDTYNQQLSERRAASVVADLTRRGLAANRLSASGIGEARPIASNTDESGRAMNRRVEVRCQ
jgi:outer membrane protein OmpA-like peptidoglycan-associated protein